MAVSASDSWKLTQGLLKLRGVAPHVVSGAFEFIAELHKAGKLTPSSINKLLNGLPALIKLAQHPFMTTDRLALIVQIFANTLDRRNGPATIRELFNLARAASPTDSDTPNFPRHLGTSNLSLLILELNHSHIRGFDTWIGDVLEFYKQYGRLPDFVYPSRTSV